MDHSKTQERKTHSTIPEKGVGSTPDLAGSNRSLRSLSYQEGVQQLAVQKPSVQLLPANAPPIQFSVEENVEGLEHMSTPVSPDEMTAEHDPAGLERNTPDPTQRLPFQEDGSGWNSEQILTHLGQYDRSEKTDSDGVRCVQAVALASYILDGPAGVLGYLNSVISMASNQDKLPDRGRTGLRIMSHVVTTIQARTATYGDLSWLMEAMHDGYYDDLEGTPLADVRAELGTGPNEMIPESTWYNSKEELLARGALLGPNEKLCLTTWRVTFNTTLGEGETHVNVTDDSGKVVGTVPRMQVKPGTRPSHTQVSFLRDSAIGHQLLLFKNANGDLRLYEPELTETGNHLVTESGTSWDLYFGDQPEWDIYEYMECMGLIRPSSANTP